MIYFLLHTIDLRYPVIKNLKSLLIYAPLYSQGGKMSDRLKTVTELR